MKVFLCLVGLVFVNCLPAVAEIKGCYLREYDAGVLKRHPKLLVTSIVLRVGVPPNDQEGFEDDVSFFTRGSKTAKFSSYSCTGSKIKRTCKLTDLGDGSRGGRGTFVLTETKNGVTLSPTSDFTLVQGDGKKLFKLDVKPNPEHEVFTLNSDVINLEECGTVQKIE